MTLPIDKQKKSRGKIIVRIDNVNETNDEVHIKFQAKLKAKKFCCCDGDNNPYVVFQRKSNAESDDFMKVWAGLNLKMTSKPIWNLCKIKIK